MTRKLFLSFTGLLLAVKRGVVSHHDLNAGLFYFGCGRCHALEPGEVGEGNEIKAIYGLDPRGKRDHDLIVVALYIGEREGRVIWPDKNVPNSFTKLNELLTSLGYRPISEEVTGDVDQYNYSVVDARVRRAGIDLEVIF